MRYFFLLAGYLISTTLAIALFKLGAGRSTFAWSGGELRTQIDGRVIAGVALYFVSFSLWLVLLAGRPLVYIVPLATALVHLAVFAVAIWILDERAQPLQLVGAGLVVIGAALITLTGA